MLQHIHRPDLATSLEDWTEYDLGALRLSAPPSGSLRFADAAGSAPDAAFFTFPEGQVRVSVLAAPRGVHLWPDRADEIATQQVAAGAQVRSYLGEWGRELAIAHGGESNWVIGVDGPRWMLLGRATWPVGSDDMGIVETMRRMLRGCHVQRGDDAFPARSPLPMRDPATAPDPIAEQERARTPYAEPMQVMTLPRTAFAPGPVRPAIRVRAAQAEPALSRTVGRGRAAALAACTVLLLGLGAAGLAMGLTRSSDGGLAVGALTETTGAGGPLVTGDPARRPAVRPGTTAPGAGRTAAGNQGGAGNHGGAGTGLQARTAHGPAGAPHKPATPPAPGEKRGPAARGPVDAHRPGPGTPARPAPGQVAPTHPGPGPGTPARPVPGQRPEAGPGGRPGLGSRHPGNPRPGAPGPGIEGPGPQQPGIQGPGNQRPATPGPGAQGPGRPGSGGGSAARQAAPHTSAPATPSSGPAGPQEATDPQEPEDERGRQDDGDDGDESEDNGTDPRPERSEGPLGRLLPNLGGLPFG